MKIKITEKSYGEVLSLGHAPHRKPIRPNIFFRTLLKAVSIPDLISTHFHNEEVGMERLGKKEPALFLMNHSSFIDLEIVSSILFPRPFNIITTGDGFIGKDRLMRLIGCIPTNKFVTDSTLVRDILYATRKLKSSIVLFPEASYSFDGTATPLPDTVGGLVKLLGIPVVMIRTFGAFARDPLYNNLRRRKVNVSSRETYLLSPEDIKNMSAEEINEVLQKEFSFDHFAEQKKEKLAVKEDFRADYLNRVLYKCPHCLSEGHTEGKGTKIFCHDCGASYTLDEYGYLRRDGGESAFDHIPDWYKWERQCVRDELLSGKYRLEVDVEICMTIDTKHLYHIGEGNLLHTADGFVLDGCGGKLHYEQKPKASYSLYSDFNWYEVGDVICIGNNEHLFYCFPKCREDCVAKARLATEELYKIVTENAKIAADCK